MSLSDPVVPAAEPNTHAYRAWVPGCEVHAEALP